jgi:Zn-dependent protease
MEFLGWTWAVASVFALLLTASFLVHEMAHKITAQKRGLWAEFRLTTWGAMLTLISVVLPFKLISPGAVMISGPVRLDEVGKISIAGPSINLALGSMFLSAAFIPSSYMSLFCIVAFINATIAVFNLIPFGILDGFKIYSWDKRVWVLTFAVAVALAVPSYMMASPYIY